MRLGGMEMHITTILCDGHTRGGPCGEEAVIRQVHYVYQPRFGAPREEVLQELVETRYDIDCPHCGARVQIDRPPALA
jgi:hypothetical protein